MFGSVGLRWPSYGILVGISILLFLISWILERFIFPDLLDFSAPQFGLPFLLRTVAVLCGSALMMVFFLRHRRSVSSTQALTKPRNIYEWFPWFTLTIAFGCMAVMLLSIEWFTRLAQEDHPLENTQAVLLFFSSAMFGWISLRIYRTRATNKGLLVATGLLLALAFFVIAMEEVSWFQRVLHVVTPETFSGNTQKELNFHNFNSTIFEELYYAGGFVLLILIAFIADQVEIPQFIKSVSLFFPSLSVLFSSAMLAAFNYNLWNRTSSQAAFFMTGFILLYYTYQSLKRGAVSGWERYLPAIFLVALIAIQVTCAVRGHFLIETWNVTEYKELFIPLGIFSYALDVLIRVRQTVRKEKLAQPPVPELRHSAR